MARPPEMELRQKAHRWVLKIDHKYRSFEYITMNEVTGLVTMSWRDRDGRLITTQTTYGQMK